MSKSRKPQVCNSCLKLKERCKAVGVDEDGEVIWGCPECLNNGTLTPLEEDGYGWGH